MPRQSRRLFAKQPPADTRRRQLQPPAAFTCPLSGEIMDDPVMDLCAHTFERRAILEWLWSSGHSCCPISRKPLLEQDLCPNHALAERIEGWKFRHGGWQKDERDGLMKLTTTTTTLTTRSGDSVSVKQQQQQDLTEATTTTTMSCSEEFNEQEAAAAMVAAEHGAAPPNNPKHHHYHHHYHSATRTIPMSSFSSSQYEALPAEFMLLPQERQVLQIVRGQALQVAAQQRKKLYCRILLMVMLSSLVVVVILAVLAYLYVQSNNRDENQDQPVEEEEKEHRLY